MSTRSVVALPHGDAWRGRYVHSDGYPTHMGPTLFALVRRNGLDDVVSTLITGDHYGWSWVSDKQPSLDGVAPDPDGAFGTAERMAYLFGPDGHYGDGRFANVPNYGVAYTVAGGARADDWHTPDPDAWTEWVYVLCSDGLLVIKQGWGGRPDVPLGMYRWTDEPDWVVVEESASVAA